jgi:hypothetical protein
LRTARAFYGRAVARLMEERCHGADENPPRRRPVVT